MRHFKRIAPKVTSMKNDPQRPSLPTQKGIYVNFFFFFLLAFVPQIDFCS